MFETIFEQAGQSISGALEPAQLDFKAMLVRLSVAAGLAAVISARPWRWLLKQQLPKIEMVQAQVLLCAAATVITVVIGDSVAKAFGLVGLGGFVRFRSGLKDPRDAAILFLLIGLGMACGHGALEVAAAGSLLFGVLLFGMDLFTREKPAPQRVKLSAQVEDPAAAEVTLRQSLGRRNVLVRASALDLDGRKIELEVEEREPGGIAQALRDPNAPVMTGLKWATVAGKPPKEEYV